ncbi:MAG: sulfatase-like hydrolase/transferase, partial [Actinomycetes bacterium]
ALMRQKTRPPDQRQGGSSVKKILALMMTLVACAGASAAASQNAVASTRPNVVFVMLDDVAKGAWATMPTVRQSIVQRGVAFRNGMVPTSLCCPSRASFLTGNYAHTTGVYGNKADGHGAWQAFQPDENSTLATHLSGSGYRTALVGKYLNGYNSAPEPYVPPGWDDFVAFQAPAYYNYRLTGTVSATHGSSPADYSTDVLSKYAADVVRDTPSSRPLFLYFAPFTAHFPFMPAPRHLNTWHPEDLPVAFNEADMSDKPSWMSDWRFQDPASVQRQQQRQHEMLMSADDAIAAIIDALGPDRMSNTLFIVMSDNGFQTGAHRLVGKNWPYALSTEVPMAMRWDGHLPSGTASRRLTLNIDLTASIAEATGTSWGMDGMSYFSADRTGTVLEQYPQTRLNTPDPALELHPGYCGYRTARWMYVEWSDNKGRELYDYRTDPDEMNSLTGDPQWADQAAQMRALAKTACSPVPPGFTWDRVPLGG